MRRMRALTPCESRLGGCRYGEHPAWPGDRLWLYGARQAGMRLMHPSRGWSADNAPIGGSVTRRSLLQRTMSSDDALLLIVSALYSPHLNEVGGHPWSRLSSSPPAPWSISTAAS